MQIILQLLKDMLNNFPLICAGLGWIAAQIIKIFTGVFKLRKFSVLEMLFGTGGMPSSHTAAAVSLTTALGLQYGLDSGYFAIGFLLCIITMRDATGVRQEAGKQAKILNRILKNLPNAEPAPESKEKPLKELVGHTSLQVFVGALVGAAVPFLVALIPLYHDHFPL